MSADTVAAILWYPAFGWLGVLLVVLVRRLLQHRPTELDWAGNLSVASACAALTVSFGITHDLWGTLPSAVCAVMFSFAAGVGRQTSKTRAALQGSIVVTGVALAGFAFTEPSDDAGSEEP